MLWETINDNACNTRSDRLRVPGGWIVRTITYTGHANGGAAVAQTFVVDHNHEWKL